MGDDRHQGEAIMEYINLIESQSDYELFENILIQKLEQGAKEHKLINVDYFKDSKKTFALLKFAKKYNCIYLNYIFKKRNDEYEVNYYCLENNNKVHKTKTYSNDDFKKLKFVVDENYDGKNIGFDDNDNSRINIVTGFCHRDKFENNFTNGVMGTLKNEVKCLIPKIEKARDKDDTGTYKNLILAFKEVLNLIYASKDRNY